MMAAIVNMVELWVVVVQAGNLFKSFIKKNNA
jgi:hypothetical protein